MLAQFPTEVRDNAMGLYRLGYTHRMVRQFLNEIHPNTAGKLTYGVLGSWKRRALGAIKESDDRIKIRAFVIERLKAGRSDQEVRFDIAAQFGPSVQLNDGYFATVKNIMRRQAWEERFEEQRKSAHV
jgi:hypothetical protein